jgi:hypothetical protein
MTKLSLMALSAVVLLAAGPAQAKMDCNKEFADFWNKINLQGGQKLDGAKLADVQRSGLRGYDACQSGDDISPRGIWDKILADMKK